MTLKIARGAEAAKMLASETVRAQWTKLYDECPWATPAQSPAFVTSWYEEYKEAYQPLIVHEISEQNELVGVLPIALHRSGRAVLPGAHQAEYKSWLALPSNGASFLRGSLKQLSRGADVRALSFRYLPAGAPVEGISTSPAADWIADFETHKRPIVRLENAVEVTDYLRQKTNKTIRNSWNRLKRTGSVRLEQVRDCEELAPIFDQLIEWYDVRQEMAHGKRPFQADSRKKPWHLRLLKEGVLHLTVLRAGDAVISAMFGLSDGKTYSVMMPAFAPEYAQYSPIAIHHLMLVERLHAENYSLLDLTPGPDPFKERFAGAYDAVKVFSVYFRQREWLKAKFRERSHAITKGMLAALGIAPTTIARNLPRIQSLLRMKRPSKAPSPTQA